LGLAAGCRRLDRSNRHEIVVADLANILRAKRHERLRSTRCRDELHADRAGGAHLDHGAQIALTQAESRQVVSEHDDVKGTTFYLSVPG
jgi:hypothetical protein